MMIRKRVRDEGQAEALKMAEEPRGVADAGYRVQPPATEKVNAHAMLRVEQILEFVSLQRHAKPPLGREGGQVRADVVAIDHDRVHFTQAGRRLAQRSGWQQPAIAESPGRINHADLDVAAEAIVLEAVIADQHVAGGMLCEKRAPGGRPIGADPHLAAAAAREQDRLITVRERIGSRRYSMRRYMHAAIAATDDSRLV